jgi:uncharacterized membrane protein YhaH (DUF805 family)
MHGYAAQRKLIRLFFPSVIALALALAQSERPHDLDRTGWWVLLGLIPLIGWI